MEEVTKTLKEASLVAVSEELERNKQLCEKKARLLTISYLIFQATAFVSIVKQAHSSGQQQNLLWIPLVLLSMLSSLIYLLALSEILTGFFWVGCRLELSFVEQGTVGEGESHYIQIEESSCN